MPPDIRPRWGSLQRFSGPQLDLKGPTSKKGEEKEEGMRGEGTEEKREEGREEGGERRRREEREERGEGRGEEAFLVMWPRRLSALNPPLDD